MRKKMMDMMQSNGVRWMILWSARVGVFVLSGVLAFSLRFDFSLPTACLHSLACALVVWIVVKSVTFHFANLNLRGLRYVSIADVYRIVLANCAGSLLSLAIIPCLASVSFPRSIYLIDLILSFLGTAGLRVAVRMVAEAMHGRQGKAQEKRYSFMEPEMRALLCSERSGTIRNWRITFADFSTTRGTKWACSLAVLQFSAAETKFSHS
jgi:hypothetical protein